MEGVKVYTGNAISDTRGTISFVNAFTFPGVKRFYQIESANTKIIRAFHGHMKEAKYAYVIAGSILLCAISLDKPKDPSQDAPVQKFILTAKNPQIVYIPPKYANGFRALEKKSQVIFFSTKTLEESVEDDYRYPYDYWGKDVWK